MAFYACKTHEICAHGLIFDTSEWRPWTCQHHRVMSSLALRMPKDNHVTKSNVNVSLISNLFLINQNTIVVGLDQVSLGMTISSKTIMINMRYICDGCKFNCN